MIEFVNGDLKDADENFKIAMMLLTLCDKANFVNSKIIDDLLKFVGALYDGGHIDETTFKALNESFLSLQENIKEVRHQALAAHEFWFGKTTDE